MNFEDIIKNADDIVKEIREYSLSQKDIWNKIPNYALEADGRTGHSSALSKIYENGLLPISCLESNQIYRIHVDLDSGRLVSPYYIPDQFRPAIPDSTNEEVLRLTYRPNALDANKYLEEFKKKAEIKHLQIYDIEEKQEWRDSIRKELGLGEIYVRK